MRWSTFTARFARRCKWKRNCVGEDLNPNIFWVDTLTTSHQNISAQRKMSCHGDHLNQWHKIKSNQQ